MRMPRFTCVSDGKPFRRLLVISKLDSSQSCVLFAIRSPGLMVAVESSRHSTRRKNDGQGTTREMLYHLATGACCAEGWTRTSDHVVMNDNPILRPVEIVKDGQETTSMFLDGNRTRIFSFSRDALTQLSYPVR